MSSGKKPPKFAPISWSDLEGMEFKEGEFLIDPYIPKESIVLLYGDTSIGKSPLTWQLVKSIGDGRGFFGLPSTKGTVLYVETDTPEVVLLPRLKKMSAAADVWWLFLPPLSAPTLSGDEMGALVAANHKLKPDLVVLNTLRKVHDLDDKDSKTPRLVYGFFQKVFPKSALLFVHHTRKQSLNPQFKEVGKEAYSGSKHWINDCQVALHLEEFKSGERKENLRLYHAKSQVTETLRPLPLILHGDGTTMSSPLYDDLFAVYDHLHEWTGTKAGLDAAVAAARGTSAKTIQRRRLCIEHGLFPGNRGFLMREDELKSFLGGRE